MACRSRIWNLTHKHDLNAQATNAIHVTYNNKSLGRVYLETQNGGVFSLEVVMQVSKLPDLDAHLVSSGESPTQHTHEERPDTCAET